MLDGYYKQRVDAIDKCFKCALKLDNTIFAVQDGGWCATSRNAKDTYQKYGASTNCNAKGTGGSMANHVYEIEGKADLTFVFFISAMTLQVSDIKIQKDRFFQKVSAVETIQ